MLETWLEAMSYEAIVETLNELNKRAAGGDLDALGVVLYLGERAGMLDKVMLKLRELRRG